MIVLVTRRSYSDTGQGTTNVTEETEEEEETTLFYKPIVLLNDLKDLSFRFKYLNISSLYI